MATIYVDNIINSVQNSELDVIVHKKPPVSRNYFYADLHLDFEKNLTIENGSYGIGTNDIRIDKDEEAIKNSLYNIFNTRKGMRYLNPEFGASFDQFLFESISIINARILAQIIKEHLDKYETRISVKSVFAQAEIEEQMYKIDIIYKILSLNTVFKNVVNLSLNEAIIT